MEFLNQMTQKWKSAVEKKKAEIREEEGETLNLTPWQKVKRVIGIIVKICYHSRKVILTIPVVYIALRLAAYNGANLPETVGLLLQADGTFLFEIARSMAVTAPLVITGGCLAMMFLARRALYAWAISVFTLVLPVLLLISNLYPA